MDNKICRPKGSGNCFDILPLDKRPSAKDLRNCITQRAKMCQIVAVLVNNSSAVSDIFEQVDLEGDTPWFVADMYDDILALHDECRGRYADGDKKENKSMDGQASDLREKTEWLRAERDDFKAKEKAASSKIIGGDMAALEDMMKGMYDKATGEKSEEDIVRDAVKDRYGYEDEDERGEDEDEPAE